MQTVPSYKLFKIWNNLPFELKRSISITMFKNKTDNSVRQIPSAIDLTVSLVNNDINLLMNLYMLTSFGKIRLQTFGSIIKLLLMIKTTLVSPNVKYSWPFTQA